MDRTAYDRMAENEERHWWFTGRRAVLAALIGRLSGRRPEGLRILEAGCGSGGNLGLLTRFGRVDALEYDPTARQIAERRSGLSVGACRLPHDVPVPDRSYDLIALLDVLEHVEEDRATLAALGRKLGAGGRILLTVPALPWLWSHHDEIHHHKRRYTRRALRATVRDAGLRIERIGYFNSLLFPLAVARRLASIALRRPTEDDRLPSAPLNGLLRRVFASERHLVGRVPLGIGLSLFAVIALPE